MILDFTYCTGKCCPLLTESKRYNRHAEAMALKELKDCIIQIPEDFDDAEGKFEERRVKGRFLHDVKHM